MTEVDILRFPVGRCSPPAASTAESRSAQIETLRRLPERLRAAVSGLSETQLDTPYRQGGWTARQVVHHLADSHANSVIRFKLALTEDEPTIKPYAEDLWAKLPDVQAVPIEVSLALLDSLHTRFVQVLKGIKNDEWKRTFRHPEQGIVALERNLALYSWHGRHHVAHVTELRKRMSW